MSERPEQPRVFSIGTCWVFLIMILLGSPLKAQENNISQPAVPLDAPSDASLTGTVGGFFGGVWDGVVDVVTLKAIFGEDEQPQSAQPVTTKRSGQRWDKPRQDENSGGSMSRMMDRMAGLVGGEDPDEDEFGLPRTR